MNIDRERARKAAWGVVLFLILVFSAYAFFIEPNTILVKNVRIGLGLEEETRIVFISDIHIGLISDEFLMEIIEEANEQDPDYILLGGDFAEHGGDGIDRLAPLKDLKPEKGIYAVLGNHDYPLSACSQGMEPENQISSYLESLGIGVMRNEMEDLGEFTLVGMDELWACQSNYTVAMQGVDRSKPVIVLVHNSEAVPDEEFEELDLVLSGHTHCGQIRLPVIGSPLRYVGIINWHDSGLHQFDEDSYIYTTCGISGGPRFLAPPEITVIDIT